MLFFLFVLFFLPTFKAAQCTGHSQKIEYKQSLKLRQTEALEIDQGLDKQKETFELKKIEALALEIDHGLPKNNVSV